MSNNALYIFYPGTVTAYAVVRLQSTFQVWSVTNSALETWSDANIAQYAIPLTSQSGDLNTGDFPEALAYGSYYVTYYQQAGGSPAITDVILGKGLFTWNGVLSPYSGSVTPSPTALTDLASVKLYLNITDANSDDRLQQFINQISAMVQRYCNRLFVAVSNSVERYDMNNQKVLNLKNYPVTGVNRVAFGYANCIGYTYSGTATECTVQTLADSVKFMTVSSSGVTTFNTFSYATYPTTSLLAAAINAASFGVTATIQTPVVASKYINPEAGVSLINAGSFYSTWPDQATVEYIVSDPAAGQLSLKASFWNGWFAGGNSFGGSGGYGGYGGYAGYGGVGGPGASLNLSMGRGRQSLMVEYSGGYTSVPDDVQFVVMELIQAAYYRSTTNTSIDHIKADKVSFKYNAENANGIVMSPSQIAVLGAYREPVMGALI
jgi:hypothetical protein